MTRRVGYASRAMPATVRPTSSDAAVPLPADDPAIFTMDLRALRGRWAAQAAMPAISAAAMVGADARAQAFGFPQDRLMEHAGTAVAAAVTPSPSTSIDGGPARSSSCAAPATTAGTGIVAARRLALAGAHVIVAVAATDMQPSGGAAARNWDRISRDVGIAKVHIPVAARRGDLRQGHRQGRGRRGRPARHRRPRRPSRADPGRRGADRDGSRGRRPDRRRGHAHGRGPHQRANRPTRSSTPT